MTEWFEEHTEPVSAGAFLQSDYVIHSVKRGTPVDFADILASVRALPLSEIHIQDPYLRTEHQLNVLHAFVKAIGCTQPPESVPFSLSTYLSNPGPGERDVIAAVDHRPRIQAVFEASSPYKTIINLLGRSSPIHMRYAWFRLVDGGERFYLFERGLDMVDQRTGNARTNSVVMEFRSVPAEIKSLMGKA
jgi:hypothetical protein